MKFFAVLLMVLFISTGVAFAEDELAEDVVQEMSTKLNRGILNILTGWVEVPRQILKAGHDKAWWAAVPVGLPSGAMMALGRTGVGAFETVFFFVPIGEDYDAILEPAYVWQ